MTLATGFMAGCSSDDDGSGNGTDSGVDPAVDAGFVDTGPAPDVGFTDTGPRPDAGHYCAMSDQVTVDGMGVPVDPAVNEATAIVGSASFSCIDSPPEADNFDKNACISQCLDFFGSTPTAEEVELLEFHAFPLTLDGEPVDPSYDYQTLEDRQLGARLPIGARVLPIDTNDCDSGYKLEMGYQSLGAETFRTQQPYILRVRSSTTTGAFATTYLYRYIRRNDDPGPSETECTIEEERIPQQNFTFPVVPAELIDSAVAAASSDVPGSADLGDGLGTGYAMIQVRDCAGGSGIEVVGATAGFLPAPIDSFYPGEDGTLGTNRETTAAGLFFAVGFPGLTETSSDSIDVRAGVGLLRNPGTCTEEYGGFTAPIFSDSVTFVRANQETVIHGR